MNRTHNARRTTLKGLAAAPLATALPAFAAAPAQKTLRYAFEVAETGLDPVQLTDLYSRILTAHLFEGLYGYDHLARPFKIKPITAESMPQVSEDLRTWTVRVRPGIYFTDDPAFKGKPRELVAEDYVYSLKRFFDPRWKAPAFASLYELRIVGAAQMRERALKEQKPFDYDAVMEGMRALDRYTLQFRFEEPRPRFLQAITSGDLVGAVAREVVEAYGDAIAEHPVGTGPFMLAEWRRSSRIVLVRNPTYRTRFYDAEPNPDDEEGQALVARFRGRRLPMIDRVEVSIIEETQPRWLSFLNRQHDLLERLPFEFANIAIPNSRLAPNLARRGVQMYRSLNSDVTLTLFNMENPVIGGYTPERVALRRAINLAIDIDQEIRLYWRGQAVPAQSGLMPNTVGFDPNFRSEMGEFNLARAKALLDMFGYVDRDGDGWREQPDGAPLVLEWATTPDQRARQRDELRRKDMSALGIRTDFRAAKWPENLKNARAGRLMVWSLGYSAASPDGQSSLDTGSSVHVGGGNLARFRNKEFDQIYERMRLLADGPERDRLFFQAKRILIAYAPYKDHVHRILTDLAQPWLRGYRRPLYWNEWWHYVDIEAPDAKAHA
ncbi:MAG TPA: ABC transporter substrate-binding protein [Burkholderiaceae bacterium]|nr:ABC transporter substrate-binding protein [Burkholderiaceae bacterium]